MVMVPRVSSSAGASLLRHTNTKPWKTAHRTGSSRKSDLLKFLVSRMPGANLSFPLYSYVQAWYGHTRPNSDPLPIWPGTTCQSIVTSVILICVPFKSEVFSKFFFHERNVLQVYMY